ncbi:MAG: DNA methyltransferase [Candidatus Lutacidiplasmatales archaeon]
MADPPRGTVRLIRGDARRLPTLRDGTVHLVVTSPPYPMIPQWDVLFRRLGAVDYTAMLQILEVSWRECFRLLAEGGILAVVIGDALRSGADGFRLWPNHAETLLAARRVGFRPLPYILWKKPTNKPNAFLGSGFLPPNAYVTLDCEFILLFRKGGLRRFPVHDERRGSSRIRREERDRWFSQIWDDIRGTPQRGPSGRTGAFPPEIPDRLVRMFSVVGDTVLDPFAGTGTTLWAAASAGREATGVEWDGRVYRELVREAAHRGLAQAPARGRLTRRARQVGPAR